MNEKEFEALKDLVKQIKRINNKLDSILDRMDGKKETTQSKDRSITNQLLYICTQKQYSDEQYTNALVQLNQLPFSLSAKQMSWILFNTPKHPDCGEDIEAFIKKQFSKQKNIVEYKEQIGTELRTKYANDNNSGFVEKLIERIAEI